METNHAKTSVRIKEVDGLRGIAILLVISFHYVNNQLVSSDNFVGKILCKLTSFGWVGVDLFFVLSGFLIGSILIRTKCNAYYFKTFYARRLARILPNYYLFLLIYVVILFVPFFKDNYMIAGNNVIPLWSYFLLIHNFYMASLENMGNGALSITWSIAVEEQFYLCFPLVIYYLKSEFLPYFLVAIIVIAIVVRMQYIQWIPAYVLLISRMDVIALGVLIAYLNENLFLSTLTVKKQIYLLVIILLDVLLCAFLYVKWNDLGAIKHTLFGVIFSACLILALCKFPYFSVFLRNRLLMWVGKISYSLYLFHYFILILFHQIVGNRGGVVINNLEDIIVTILSLMVSFICAWLVFRKIELPIVEWGKRISHY